MFLRDDRGDAPHRVWRRGVIPELVVPGTTAQDRRPAVRTLTPGGSCHQPRLGGGAERLGIIAAHSEAQKMPDTFACVGATCLDITRTNRAGAAHGSSMIGIAPWRPQCVSRCRTGRTCWRKAFDARHHRHVSGAEAAEHPVTLSPIGPRARHLLAVDVPALHPAARSCSSWLSEVCP